MEENRNFPTMIIPTGTEITVNEKGQLSIRTPGNLVIQNSGAYSVIESMSGSVRIDPEVKVEAVTVQAADSCFVGGVLTAWRVKARKITLEKGAQANIMLQESESLELDRSARLVGNFASEKELYLTLGRFSRQLRSLPNTLGMGQAVEHLPGGKHAATAEETDGPFAVGPSEPPSGPRKEQERAEVLSMLRVVVEREIGRPGVNESGRQALERLLDLVRSGDLAALDDSYRYLFSQVEQPSEDLDAARISLSRLLHRT